MDNVPFTYIYAIYYIYLLRTKKKKKEKRTMKIPLKNRTMYNRILSLKKNSNM